MRKIVNATVALFDGHSPDAIPWFKRWRSLLRRHGHHSIQQLDPSHNR